MGVEERLKKDAEVLARAVDRVDKDALLARIFDAANEASGDGEPLNHCQSDSQFGERARRAVEPVVDVKLEARLLAAGPPAPLSDFDPNLEAEILNEPPDLIGELVHLLGHARAIAPVARRIAEILELFERPRLAWSWWEIAAELGDPDAIDYASLASIAPEDSSIPRQRAVDLAAETRKAACEVSLAKAVLALGSISKEQLTCGESDAIARRPIVEWQALVSSDQRILKLLRGEQSEVAVIRKCRYGFPSWVDAAKEAAQIPLSGQQEPYPDVEKLADAPSVAELEDLVRWG
ncbi:hypothetical protein ACGFIR_18135 [Micromonospora sp. NPDC049051]|uniref:hypothetical protein n=1 Tax=Micromonospora sp. NPDC049051 TaxID=3364264 RepID=UPI003723D9E4